MTESVEPSRYLADIAANLMYGAIAQEESWKVFIAARLIVDQLRGHIDSDNTELAHAAEYMMNSMISCILYSELSVVPTQEDIDDDVSKFAEILNRINQMPVQNEEEAEE